LLARENGERDNTGARGNGPAAGSAQGRAGGRADNRDEAGKETDGSWADGPKAKNEMENVFFFSFSSFQRNFK
jgi:hypothetical protein